ncbi:MAG: response regulator [Chloroflexota bacterium]|nr:response regulator [Chloroflexota bacterium]
MADELILIVDDEELIRRQAEAALRKGHYRTATAGNAQEALQLIRQNPPDLVLSDIRMPDMDGLQLFGAARQIQPDLVAVLMTAHGSIDTAIKALQLGVQGFLQKPFTGSELERAIQDALQKHRTVQEAVRLRVLNPLLEARRLLLTDLNLSTFSRTLIEVTAREVSLDYCAVFLPEEENPAGGLRPEAVFAGPNARFFSPKTFPAVRLAQRAVELGRTLSLRRASGTENQAESAVPGVVMAIPLLIGNQGLGAFLVGRVNLEKGFSAGERELFEILAGQLATMVENRRLFLALTEREERLRSFIGKFVSAQEDEKRQLAQRIQDDLMPLLTGGRQGIQSYLAKARPASAGDLPAAEQKIHTAISEARHLIQDLRPINLEEFGLSAALRQYVRDLNEVRNNNRVTFRLEGQETPRLDPSVETAIFRATQEAVGNACKHAPGSPVEVAVRVHAVRNKPQRIQIEINDTGKGFDLNAVKTSAESERGKPGQRLGLLAMQERVILVGGQCQIESNPNRGTTVTITYNLSFTG